jgi:hypothetical protein
MKWIFSMLASFKYLSLLISFILLTACWPLEEKDKKSSNPSLLPEVNKSLSNESPVGIWMLDIDATSEITNFQNNNTDIKSVEKSKHKIREFITVVHNIDEEYFVRECVIGGKPNVISWHTSIPLVLKDNTLSLSIVLPPEDLETFQVIGVPLNSQTTLKFENNLSVQGTASQVFKNRIFHSDPLFTDQVSKDQHHLLQIKGVKISNETNFFNASELTTQLTINDMPFLNSEKTAIKCLRTDDISTTITQYHSDAPQEVTNSSENLLLANFNDTNRIFLQILISDDSKEDKLNVFSNDSIFPNLNIPFYLPDCDHVSNNCEEVTDIKLNTKKNTSNILESLITASTSDNNEVNIKVSIEVH